jgi:hypothetical protein
MNKASMFNKRELCYFIRSDGINYIFKKRLLGKVIKMEFSGDIYIEKSFRFIRIFTDEELRTDQRKIYFILRREHSNNIGELIEKVGFIDYNLILNERRQKKIDEMKSKALLMKDNTTEKVIRANQKMQNVFSNIFFNKCKTCGAALPKNSDFCNSCGANIDNSFTT